VYLSRNLDQNMLVIFRKTVKTAKALGALPLNPWLPAARALPQTPSYCSHILLQLRNLKAFLGGTKKYYAPRRKGNLALPVTSLPSGVGCPSTFFKFKLRRLCAFLYQWCIRRVLYSKYIETLPLPPLEANVTSYCI